jgi:drug/metabolite transporter (DMT)-like permease
MRTKPIAFLLFLKATFLISVSQVLLKIGMKNFDPSIMGMLSNYFLIVGIGLYGLAAIFVVYGLKNGELSVLYPIIATTYIWVSLLAFYIFKEHMGVYKLLGIGSVVVGVALIGIGASRASRESKGMEEKAEKPANVSNSKTSKSISSKSKSQSISAGSGGRTHG